MDLEERLAAPTSRRTVISTGAKLAYAAPLLAASFSLRARGASAAGTSPVGCFHSIGGNDGGGCMSACTQSGCTGDACDGFGDPDGPCTQLCFQTGGDNPCCNPGLCDPLNFTCEGGVAVYHGPTTGCP